MRRSCASTRGLNPRREFGGSGYGLPSALASQKAAQPANPRNNCTRVAFWALVSEKRLTREPAPLKGQPFSLRVAEDRTGGRGS
jgi:hypothetical protein